MTMTVNEYTALSSPWRHRRFWNCSCRRECVWEKDKNSESQKFGDFLSPPSALFTCSSSLMSQSGLKVRDGPQTPKRMDVLVLQRDWNRNYNSPRLCVDLVITHLPSSDLTNTGCSKANILPRAVPLPVSWDRCILLRRTWTSLFSNNSWWVIVVAAEDYKFDLWTDTTTPFQLFIA